MEDKICDMAFSKRNWSLKKRQDMSKRLLQKTVILSFTSLLFLAFSYNQKSFCMDGKEDQRHLGLSRAFPLLPDEAEVHIFSFLDQWDFLKRTVLVSKDWQKATERVWKINPLNLQDNKIGDEKTEALSNSNLSNLTSLNLQENYIGDEGAKALSVGNFTKLISLYLGANNIGDEGKEAFSKKKANLTITFLYYGEPKSRRREDPLLKLRF